LESRIGVSVHPAASLWKVTSRLEGFGLPESGPAEGGRLECRKRLSYGREWNGKAYATKQVRPIFAEEPNEILVVTVYVYYF
jgi:hypothetical protein